MASRALLCCDCGETTLTFVCTAQHSLEGFPVQFVVPLLPAVAATFRFGAVELSSPPSARFDVPQTYSRPDDAMNPSQEVFQHVAAV